MLDVCIHGHIENYTCLGTDGTQLGNRVTPVAIDRATTVADLRTGEGDRWVDEGFCPIN